MLPVRPTLFGVKYGSVTETPYTLLYWPEFEIDGHAAPGAEEIARRRSCRCRMNDCDSE